jgi:hypothetical protein
LDRADRIRLIEQASLKRSDRLFKRPQMLSGDAKSVL